MQALTDAVDRLPVATLIHLIVAVVLGVGLIVNGSLSSDALTYAAIVEGGNGLVGLGRAHIAAAKVTAATLPDPDELGDVALPDEVAEPKANGDLLTPADQHV